MRTKIYLALGDSMSIDKYTGMPGGGARPNSTTVSAIGVPETDWNR